jgi:hypothetical protein
MTYRGREEVVVGNSFISAAGVTKKRGGTEAVEKSISHGTVNSNMAFVSDKPVKRRTALSRKSINNSRMYGLKFLDALDSLCLTEAIFQEVDMSPTHFV